MYRNEVALHHVFDQATLSGERPLRTLKRSQDILQTCLRTLSSVYIVIDGIDECSVPDKRSIATFMKSTVSTLQNDDINIRCLFSSQHDEDTSKLFRGVSTLDINAGEALDNDIKNFCLHEGEVLKTRFALSEPETEGYSLQVSAAAKGMSGSTSDVRDNADERRHVLVC